MLDLKLLLLAINLVFEDLKVQPIVLKRLKLIRWYQILLNPFPYTCYLNINQHLIQRFGNHRGWNCRLAIWVFSRVVFHHHSANWNKLERSIFISIIFLYNKLSFISLINLLWRVISGMLTLYNHFMKIIKSYACTISPSNVRVFASVINICKVQWLPNNVKHLAISQYTSILFDLQELLHRHPYQSPRVVSVVWDWKFYVEFSKA